ncbi:MAG: tyrosine-type recombinase/integrase [Phycisphaerae bacterium]|nr:tyrosine-type recombinase/integrase [Phycisphaerae bacterium]
MRVFKSTFRNKAGQKQLTKKWYIDFADHLQIRRRLPAFEDKRPSEALGRQIERLVSSKIAGEKPDAQLTRWLEGAPVALSNRLVSIGLLDSHRAAAGKPLKKHIEDFEASLLAKGNTEKYTSMTIIRVKRIFDECKFLTWTDISASRVERTIPRLRKSVKNVEVKKVNGKRIRREKFKDLGEISAQTQNYYLQAIKQFCRWMVQDRRAVESPLEHLTKVDTKTDRRHDRRAFDPDEIRRLLETTQAQPKRFGMAGHERAMLYRLAVETGLRAKELRSLKKTSFDFNKYKVTVDACYTKNRNIAIRSLRKDTAALLQNFLANKMPHLPAFNVPHKTANMLKADLEAAGIPYIDEAGHFADFHSLRHSTGSLLAAAGVHPKLIQLIMRHSDINLTMNRYTHVFSGQESEAIAKLPDLSLPSSEQQKAMATGTDGKHTTPEKNSAIYSAIKCGEHRANMDNSGHPDRDNDSETAILNTVGWTIIELRYLPILLPLIEQINHLRMCYFANLRFFHVTYLLLHQ